MEDRSKSVASRGFGGLEFGRQSMAGTRDRGFSRQSHFGAGLGGLGGPRRQTQVDGSDFQNLRKMTIGLEELRKEELINKKIDKVVIGGSGTQRILYEFIRHPSFSTFVQICVFMNILLLILPYIESMAPWMNKRTNLLHICECFFVAVYAVEMLVKIYVWRWSYLIDIWDNLDLLLVIISFVDLIMQLESKDAGGSNASSLAKSGKMLRILRSTRILRILRTMKWLGKLEQYVTTIVKSTRQLGPIAKLFFSAILIFSCLGCSLFGRILPDRFGNFLLTFFTLIQLLTLDDWFEILQEGSVYRYDPRKSQIDTFSEINMALFIFLVVYIFLMTFIILNLLIAVLVDNFQLSFEQARYKEASEEDEQKQFLNQIDNMDESDDEGMSENQTEEVKEDVEKDEFDAFFQDCSGTDLLLRQWYYRLFPAIEKHMFFFNDQMTTYEQIVDEAINQSDDLYHMTH